MIRKTLFLLCLLLGQLLMSGTCLAVSHPFVAYSMQEAERRARANQNPGQEVTLLGGITRLIGAVYDSDRDDLIIVGQIVPDVSSVSLEDLVVALRSRFVYNEWPEVSIDRNPSTDLTKTQTVRYEGGIENTHFGRCFLEADVVLKKISLGLLPTDIWNLSSYYEMAVAQRKLNPEENMLSTRFWFNPVKRYSVAIRPGVVALNSLKINVKAQLESHDNVIEKAGGTTNARNEVAEHFAELLSRSYDDLSFAYPEVAALKPLMDLLAIAKGVQDIAVRSSIDFWLNEYTVRNIETPLQYPLLKRESKIPYNNNVFVFQVDGGVAMEAMKTRLSEEGDITALRDLVCMSRPADRVLTWRVPLEGWNIPGYESTDDVVSSGEHNEICLYSDKPGCTINERVYVPGRTHAMSQTAAAPKLNVMGQSYTSRDFGVTQQLFSKQRYTRGIGGVMLSGMAEVDEADKAEVNMADGNFSLVVNGQDARLDPNMFRKFVTALWAVYYGQTDPGISIDPIYQDPDTGEFSEKHMVRYIGKVINTDLGRVMREADYQMKKWSVGTERADIPGFKTPDDYSAMSRVQYRSLSRFWLTPENLKFTVADNMLLFDCGNMTVQTEVLGYTNGQRPQNPHNEAFAGFFTDNYREISQRYPIYKELEEYGKLVALSKYLKDSGVPLFWFLMANKDLVLTEDSPGTVDNLAKDSDHWKGVTIQGGVDMSTSGRYVFDASAVKAIADAIKASANHGGFNRQSATAKNPTPTMPFSFDLGKQQYSVVPQHSLSSGKDRRGIRYQTDLALRTKGFRLTEKSWQALKYDVTYLEFAQQWNRQLDSLSESRLMEQGQKLYMETWSRAEQKVAETLNRMERLVEKKYESEEAFDEAVYGALGRSTDTELLGLVKKHAYYQTDLELVRFFNPKRRTEGQFGRGWDLLVPYRIKPVGTAMTNLHNISVPSKVAVENLVTGEQEQLLFDAERFTAAGYVPEKRESSQILGLFIMTDASYKLVDKLGNEFCFCPDGRLSEMSFSNHHNVKIEYFDSPGDALLKRPYLLQAANNGYIQVLNVMIPRVMIVTNLVDDSAEEFVFSDTITAYVPQKGMKSRYEILNLMTDCSFRLRDKAGNEIAFEPDGSFAAFDGGTDTEIVKSISAGPYTVAFEYTLGSTGRILAAGARLSEAGQTKTLYAVDYDYDNEERLCGVKRSQLAQAQLPDSDRNVVIMAKK